MTGKKDKPSVLPALLPDPFVFNFFRRRINTGRKRRESYFPFASVVKISNTFLSPYLSEIKVTKLRLSS